MADFSGIVVGSVEIDDGAIIEYVERNYEPADVYSTSELSDWAENNGYVREE